jgi:hypothetical protein
MSSVIDPAVLLDPNRPSPPDLQGTAMKDRLSEKESLEVSPASKIIGCTAQGPKVILTLAEAVDRSAAEDPKNYLVMVNGQTYLLSAGAISYDSQHRTVTLRDLPLRPGDQVAVTVMGLWDSNKDIPAPSVTVRTQVLRASRRKWIWLVIPAGVVLAIVIIVIALVT